VKRRLAATARHRLGAMLERECDRIQTSLRALAEAEQRLGVSQASEGASFGPDADLASDLAEQQLDLGLAEAASVRLDAIEEALRRLANGRYGACEGCGQAIASPRLRALPWARTCVHCADQGIGSIARQIQRPRA
jgi:DnaK suppressor protein